MTDTNHPPSDVDPPDLALMLQALVGLVQRRTRQVASSRLTLSQVSALVTVERYGPLSLGRIATLETVTPPTVTKLVQHLEKLGLVRRRPDPNDRRSALIQITAQGRRELNRARKVGVDLLRPALGTLLPQERRVMARAIRSMSDMLSAHDVIQGEGS